MVMSVNGNCTGSTFAASVTRPKLAFPYGHDQSLQFLRRYHVGADVRSPIHLGAVRFCLTRIAERTDLRLGY